MSINVTSYLPADVAGAAASVPRILWELYIEYLWNYQPTSWVATIAYVFRVISVLMFIPILAVTLLDLVSYGLARTLGIIDTTGKKTSDEKNTAAHDSLDPSQPHAYFTSEESNVKLAGGHDISPVASATASPTSSRSPLPVEEDDKGLRQRRTAAAQ